jgi:hypothetical protein
MTRKNDVSNSLTKLSGLPLAQRIAAMGAERLVQIAKFAVPLYATPNSDH